MVRTNRSEHRVKAVGELGVPVTDEEPETPTGLFEVGGEVTGDLGHPTVRSGWLHGSSTDEAIALDRCPPGEPR